MSCRRHDWDEGTLICRRCDKIADPRWHHFVPPSVRFWRQVDTTGDCWLWRGQINRRGYGVFSLGGRQITAHRAALILDGIEMAGLDACHRCDNPPCVRPSHLFPATHRENIHDARAKGRLAFGDRNGMRLRMHGPEVA